ncbi:hypothetical protein QYE76_065772 [Lolium multiflorum]|uniref:Reverse transcriptase domain-containing protein n=1 Tax=Lolium multiflorum TaxID=4521 RepID=A0AAD8SBI5_LOLMU|nr:hypothetical protein QYE76_065772 [Lolium multiflorum]
MENLLPESKALYQLLRSETKEEYESRFATYKKEMLDAVKVFIDDTKEQIKDVHTTVDGVRTTVSADLQAAKESIGAERDAVKSTPSSEIAGLAAAVDRAMRFDPGAVAGRPSTSASKEVDACTVGPDGRHWETQNRGTNYAQHTNCPEGDSEEETLDVEQEPVNQQLMMLSVAAISPDVNAPRTMQLQAQLHGYGAESYDGIIGLDWLGKYSPMTTHWEQGWLGIQHEGRHVNLHGEGPMLSTHALIELHLIREAPTEQPVELPPEVQSVLEQYSTVFEAPTALPSRRLYDHHIPLIPGARPISIRPYRVAPELKTDIERKIKELLDHGVITHSNSAFGSPILLVKKADHSWRLVVDYRHLNVLTVKGKYPLPVIDELLDELAGTHWFSKLDLNAGYHQIRLAPGEEYKTAFQSHNGHYEFKVMAFGLTGAPATFQHAMNASLAPVLRKFALVFFDDIRIYTATYDDHLQHLAIVLDILKRDQCSPSILTLAMWVLERFSQQGHPLAYVSRALGPRNRMLSVYEEYLAILLAVQQWRSYLQVGEFIIRTDHKILTHLTDQRLHTEWQPKALTKLMGLQYKWLQERSLIIASVRQHLLRMQQRMKAQADKHRTERTFEVGAEVFLRLQPYLQSSVARRANHKLAFKFFGPFRVLERVSPVLPPPDALFQIPVKILQQRVCQRGVRTVAQARVQWSGGSENQATWEDVDALRQQFPYAPAWGQAAFQEKGIVSGPATYEKEFTTAEDSGPTPARPKRDKRDSSWLADGHWVT